MHLYIKRKMELQIQLHKMITELSSPVNYYLKKDHNKILVNEWLNKTVEISYLHKINCLYCNKITKKSFFQGFCYPCFISLPQADPSVVNPELCRAHEGISRDMDWAKENCLIDHHVYLSLTSGLKVGVTRDTQIPTRWIDQGAEYAIKLAKTPYRQLAGIIEVELKPYVADKTSWQRMLKSSITDKIDLVEEKEKLIEYLPEELQHYISDEDDITTINFPVLTYPDKVKSINLDKTDSYKGVLTGIKGQYLMFSDGYVFNVRKHGGYNVSIKVDAY